MWLPCRTLFEYQVGGASAALRSGEIVGVPRTFERRAGCSLTLTRMSRSLTPTRMIRLIHSLALIPMIRHTHSPIPIHITHLTSNLLKGTLKRVHISRIGRRYSLLTRGSLTRRSILSPRSSTTLHGRFWYWRRYSSCDSS